jgi:hypothetical protein
VPEELKFASMDPSSPYVSALCGLDLASTVAAEEPVAALIELLETVSTGNRTEQDELDRIITGFAVGAKAADPATSPELHDALQLLGGRCAR